MIIFLLEFLFSDSSIQRNGIDKNADGRKGKIQEGNGKDKKRGNSFS